MALKAEYTPSISDDSVKAKTGMNWTSWFKALDKLKAQTMPHKEIAALIDARYPVGGWWAQMVTVEYERAWGLRAVHEKTDGFSVSASKTVASTADALYNLAADAKRRKAWFPAGAFKVTSTQTNKSVRGVWEDGSRVTINLYENAGGKAQIAIEHSKLAGAGAVELARTQWKEALGKLAGLLKA